MARIIGYNHHLSKLARRDRNKILALLPVYVIGLAICLIFPLILPVIAVCFAFVTYRIIRLLKRFVKYRKGIKGEMEVERVLRNLNDSYVVINNVRLPNRSGNIDHVVVGPTGVFVIETKNIRGNFICEGDEWYKIKNGRVRKIRSISRQAKQNAYNLRMFLKRYGCDQFVHCLIVLTNKECKVDLINPSVPVVGVENLTKFITNVNTQIPQKKIHEIVGIIITRSNFPAVIEHS